MEIGFTARCVEHAKRMHDSFWILDGDEARRYEDGDLVEVVRVVPLEASGSCPNRAVSYDRCKRLIHQRDGRINQALLNDSEFERFFLVVPKNPVGLGAMWQDSKFVPSIPIFTICVDDVTLHF